MRPVFVCQLPNEEQREVRRMLEGLILHGCGGDVAEVEHHYGNTLEKLLQNGMDSKIVDLDYLMIYYAEDFQSEKADKQFCLADAAIISSILRESRKQDTPYPFVEVPAPADEWER